jgi:hypothetical protein
MADATTEEHPRKRIRLEENVKIDAPEYDDQLAREKRSGITHFVNPDTPGFSGILKQRLVLWLLFR